MPEPDESRETPAREPRCVVVVGTGTGIGKTLVAAALVQALAQQRRKVVGLKPIESGVIDGAPADGDLLERLSTFHVKRFRAPYLFERPVSPHLAARDAGDRVDLTKVVAWVDGFRSEADALVVESAGGLFSPLTTEETNADLTARLRPDAIVLVAPDRLGVLHDVGATLRAARAIGLAIHEIVLSAPAEPDASTGTNAAELDSLFATSPLGPIVVSTLPRTTLDSAAEILAPLVARIVGTTTTDPR